ncbi:MAG: hypothetical protein U5N56_01130 [Candidatus Marinimicrobia bacterium]|nr:hypothetical protein [Candidatus Neomarinimicrobiota bacterium]
MSCPPGHWIIALFSYSTLNGYLKIYDRKKKKNITVGKGAGLRWSEVPGEFAYTRIELDDRGGTVNTDILLRDIDGTIRFPVRKVPVIGKRIPVFFPADHFLYEGP